MAIRYLIGLGAGAASAVLFASALAGSNILLGVLLHMLAPLPMFLAGFGWGQRSSFIAVVTGAVVVAAAAKPFAGLIFAVWPGIPVILLCYLAFLNRPEAGSGDGMVSEAKPNLEWYPVGRIVAWATVLAVGLAIIFTMTRGLDFDTQRSEMRKVVEQVLKLLPTLTKGRTLAAAEINQIAEMLLYALPGATAVSWLFGIVLNMWLAGRITLASGRLARPWPDIPAMTYPAVFALGLACALALTFTSMPMLRLASSAMAGGFVFAYGLLGLAVLHYVTRGNTWRGFALAGVYFSLIYLSAIGFVGLAILGLTESLFGFRRYFGQNQGPPSRSI